MKPAAGKLAPFFVTILALCAMTVNADDTRNGERGIPLRQTVPDLLSTAGCSDCHHATEMQLGPPFAAIASRYIERKDVMREVMAQKILYGGAGNWGAFPMVANEDKLSVEDARAIAEWILDLVP